jgi:NADH-quinone oxidoreductase subunit L
VTAGVFVTAFYSFRMYFLVFHGKERFHNAHHTHDHDDKDDDASRPPRHGDHTPHETPWVVTLPLILLAIPSLIIGYHHHRALLFGNWFGHAIQVARIACRPWKNWRTTSMAPPPWVCTPANPAVLAGRGRCRAVLVLLHEAPDIPAAIQKRFSLIYTILDNKYGFDAFNDWFFAGGARFLGGRFWRWGDVAPSTALGQWHGAAGGRISPASCGICNPVTSITMPSR